MLTSEKRVMSMKKGRPQMIWKPIRARNEALDYTVYNLAALAILNPNYQKIQEKFVVEKKEIPKENNFKRTGGWVNK